MKKLLLGAVLLLTLTSCVPEDGSEGVQTTSQAAPSPEQRLEELRIELGGDPNVAPNKVKVEPQLFPLPPDWVPPNQGPAEGHRLYSVEVRTVDQANLPTVRRFGAHIYAVADDGSIAVNPETGLPFFVDGTESSPHIFDISIGPGITLFVVQVVLLGRIGEGLIVTVDEYGTGPTGLMGGGRIEAVYPGQTAGTVVAEFPVPIL